MGSQILNIVECVTRVIIMTLVPLFKKGTYIVKICMGSTA